MTTMFKTRSSWAGGEMIVPAEVVRTTPHHVVVRSISGHEFRESKSCAYHKYHETWEDAHKHLIEEARTRWDLARRREEAACCKLSDIERMKKP